MKAIPLKQIIIRLLDSGMTRPQVSKQTDISSTTLMEILEQNAQEISWDSMQKLIALSVSRGLRTTLIES